MKRILATLVSLIVVFSTFSILSPKVKSETILRAWKDDTSLGLENEHLLLHGSAVTGNYFWFFDYLVFKDTGTTWYQPWGELAILVYPNFQWKGTVTTDFEVSAFTDADKAYLKYSITSGNLREELTYTIYSGEPYIYATLSLTNIGSVTENTYAGVQFTTWIAGDHANDYFYVPGVGQGQFTGVGNVNFPDATETWIAEWDQNKGEGCGMLSTKGFNPNNMITEDFGIGEGFKFISDSFDLAPGQSSAVYDCYLYFFTGTGWQQAKEFYDSLELSPYRYYAKSAEARSLAYAVHAEIMWYYGWGSGGYGTSELEQAIEDLIPVLYELAELSVAEMLEDVQAQLENTGDVIESFETWLTNLQGLLEQSLAWIDNPEAHAAAQLTYYNLEELKNLCEQEASAWRSEDVNEVKRILRLEKSEIRHASRHAEKYFQPRALELDEVAYDYSFEIIDFLDVEKETVVSLKHAVEKGKLQKIKVNCDVDLHVYDLYGNHNGPIYDEQGEVIGFEEDIPDSWYVGPLTEPEIVAIFNASSMVYKIEIVGRGSNSPTDYMLTIMFYNESGALLADEASSHSIVSGEIHTFTVDFSETDLELHMWHHVFADEKRDTELRVNIDEKYFQFITPDKMFAVKYDPDMFVYRHVIIICYKDDEIKLVTIAIDTRIDFCFAYAKDVQTGDTYWLIDKLGKE